MPIIDIKIIPAADHIAYAILTSMVFKAKARKTKQAIYPTNIAIVGKSIVNPLDIFIIEVANTSNKIAIIRKIHPISLLHKLCDN